MIVSNSLSFTFMENKETRNVFNFIVPALKLSEQQAISDRILSNSANELTKSILQITSNNKIRVTIAFDSWTNIKQKHLLELFSLLLKIKL